MIVTLRNVTLSNCLSWQSRNVSSLTSVTCSMFDVIGTRVAIHAQGCALGVTQVQRLTLQHRHAAARTVLAVRPRQQRGPQAVVCTVVAALPCTTTLGVTSPVPRRRTRGAAG